MLVAVEGVDGVGKTTLFEKLKLRVDAVFVPNVPMTRMFQACITEAEIRTAALWEALYDPSRFYVCDRCPFVSNSVYQRVYKRPIADYSRWHREVRVVYLEGPSRPDDIATPERILDALAAYVEVLKSFYHVRFFARDVDLVTKVLKYLHSCKESHRCESLGYAQTGALERIF